MPTRFVLPKFAALAVASLAVTAGGAVAATPLAAQAGGAAGQTAPQATGIVTGRVTETGSGRPLGDVQVFVTGTRLGAVTDANGNFRIANVPTGAQTLRARRIGYSQTTQAVTVAAGGPTEVTIALSVAATELDRVVITGTPGATSQRTVGNAVTTLDVQDLTEKSSLTSVSDVLQSKSPGVTLIPGSGTPGTAADIRIRGTSSLSASNRPIIYIDGVRMNDASNGSYGPSGAGTGGTFSQGTSALDALNPEDIESVQVIKGPAASTLYGADAAGGVIQVITKKGTRGSQKVRWTAKAEMGGSDWALQTLDNYTTCTEARIAQKEADGTLTWPGCQGKAPGTVLTSNPLRDDPHALRTGQYQNYNIAVRGGSDRYSYYVSGDQSLDEGVFFNSYNKRRGARANFGFTPNDKIDFQVNSSYIQTHTRLPLGDDAAGGVIISATRGQPGNFANQGRGWRLNVPEVSNQYDNQNQVERTILGATVNYHPFSWFRNRFTTGVDFNSPLATVFYAPGSAFSAGDFPSGFIAQRAPQTHLYTFDYAGIISNTLPVSSLTSEFSFGVQGVKNQYRNTQATGTGLPAPDLKLVQRAAAVAGLTDFTEQASLGYFVQEQVGYANRLFVTGALRADDNSAFGKKFDKVYYPKASLSYVVSEEPSLENFFRTIRADNVKLRLAYGQAGRAPGPYDALRTYTSSRVVLGSSVSSGLVPSAPGNENLKPERGIETEYGFDAGFLGDRAGIEFTGYSKRTKDALVSLGNPPSLGFTGSRYINFGEIKNSGVELGLRGTPVRTNSVTWETRINYSTNQNKLMRLNTGGITQLIPYNPYPAYPSQLIKEGYPVGGYWAVDALRNPDGSYVTTTSSAGVVSVVVDTTLRYVGPATPKYEGSFSNTVTLFKNVRLYALIDFKGGNYLFDQKDRNRNQASNRNSRLMNDPAHPLSAADTSYYSGTITKPWIKPADFVKLRDVSVSYTIPAQLTSRLGGTQATLTFAGHNLGFLSKRYSGIDPEVNFFGQGTFYNGTTNFVQFVRTDSYTLPMLRRFTGSINLSF